MTGETLYCDNKLTSLDVSDSPLLTYINCHYNSLYDIVLGSAAPTEIY
ncbi:MAG: hypothetical protein ACLSVD_08145 [Eggerthellaceae bacterium]